MNILGPCLKPILGAYPLSSTTSYFIVYDHLEKEEGTYQVRRGGSANGHNGMRSCITTLRDLKDEVWHVRIGIGRPSNVGASFLLLGSRCINSGATSPHAFHLL